jgi:tRNA(Ile)-lysidine synthase
MAEGGRLPGAGPALPLTAGEVATAFGYVLEGHRHVLLALSGGSDSTALMHLAAEWARSAGDSAPALSVATVDHGLRSGSAREADLVATAARGIGLPHATLGWVGPKPQSGVQEAAREARYRLLAAHARAIGATAIATAHTEDDQAETLLMRLARGSGLDGLTAIAPRGWRDGCALLRPLLVFSKARLAATLSARAITWIEDPSNDEPRFERVRWRQARPELNALGLEPVALALSARRLQRARAALASLTDDIIERAGPALRVSPLGTADLDWRWLGEAIPAEIALRLLARLIGALGGSGRPPSLSRLEAMTCDRGWASPAGRSLGGVVFGRGRDAGRVTLTREWGRRPLPETQIARGGIADWDHRYTVVVSAHWQRPVVVGALGPEGLAALEAGGLRRPPAPARALWSQPAFRDGARMLAVPTLGYVGPELEPGWVGATLTSWPFALEQWSHLPWVGADIRC